jgi:hypothetical protein
MSPFRALRTARPAATWCEDVAALRVAASGKNARRAIQLRK